jgi:hypothetical protein
MSDSDFILNEQEDPDWKLWMELRRELKILADPDPKKVILSSNPAAASRFLQVLKKNEDWLPSGQFEDSRGRTFDIIDILRDPEMLGDLKHLYKAGSIFAIVRKTGSMSDLILLDHSLRLRLDSTDRPSRRLRLFIPEIGMLTLREHDVRELVVHDQSFS